MPKHGRLITRTRAYLKNLLSWLDIQYLGHQGHDVRLRNSLTFPYGKWVISIRLGTISPAHKAMSLNGAHGLKDPAVRNIPSLQLP